MNTILRADARSTASPMARLLKCYHAANKCLSIVVLIQMHHVSTMVNDKNFKCVTMCYRLHYCHWCYQIAFGRPLFVVCVLMIVTLEGGRSQKICIAP